MRIVLAIKYFHERLGGAELMACHTANVLAEAGHHVSICSFEGKDGRPAFYLDERVEVHDGLNAEASSEVTERVTSFEEYLSSSGGAYAKEAIAWVRRHRGMSAKWGTEILRSRPDCVIGFMQHGFIPLVPAIAGQARFIASFQNDPALELARFSNPDLSDEENLEIFSAILSKADGVSILLDVFRGTVGQLYSGSTFVVPNFTEVIPADPRSTLARPVVLGAGRLVAVKEFPLFVDAMKTVVSERPDALAIIYGEGPDREALERQARDLWLQPNVVFPGPTRNLARFFAEASAAVMPSSVEGFGLVALEAMACGVPPIVFADCPALAEVVGSGGIVLQDRSVGALAAAILSVISSPEGAEARRQRAMDKAKQYSRAAYAAAWLEAVKPEVT